jgi:hypothetical protein
VLEIYEWADCGGNYWMASSLLAILGLHGSNGYAIFFPIEIGTVQVGVGQVGTI